MNSLEKIIKGVSYNDIKKNVFKEYSENKYYRGES